MKDKRLFEEDLSYENRRKAFYDGFYEQNGIKVISRTDWDTDDGQEKQKEDIDAYLKIGGTTFSVSEKDRNKNYGDILVELFHIFDDGTRENGWIEDTEADLLSYFTPDTHFFVNMQSLKEVVLEIIVPALHSQIIGFEHESLRFKKVYANIGGKSRTMSLTSAHNSRKNRTWDTFSICIPVSDLKDYGVTIDKTEIE